MNITFIRNVLPGDSITESGRKCYGIVEDKATIAGQLCKIENLIFIRSKTQKYAPRKFDIVIGKVFYSSQEFYKIDLNGSTGILPALSFMNATKRNKVELNKGDLVLAQVIRMSHKNRGDPLLCCKGEGLGPISDAFYVEPWKVRLLYFNDFLKKIKQNFKIAMGMNGFIYIVGSEEAKKEVIEMIEQINFE